MLNGYVNALCCVSTHSKTVTNKKILPYILEQYQISASCVRKNML